MTQEDGYLEVEKSFLMRPRFHWSIRFFWGEVGVWEFDPQIWVL
jgi:hypothetical protein